VERHGSSCKGVPQEGGKSKGKADDDKGEVKGWGKGIWQLDGEKDHDHERNQPEEEKPGGIEAVTEITNKNGLSTQVRWRKSSREFLEKALRRR
jgi:hypothetical protein